MRHIPFLKTLATAKNAGDPVWRDAALGYLVLRFLDRWMEEGPVAMSFDPFITALKGRLRSNDTLAPEVRRTLLRFVNGLVAVEDVNPSPAIGHLFEYGDYLKLNGYVNLAGHVYTVIVEVLERADPHTAQLAAACIQCGITFRILGKFDGAKISFERAAVLAAERNDFAQMVRARSCIANLLKVQGNLPQAEQEFDALVFLVRTAHQPMLEAKVRQQRAAVYYARQKYPDAMRDYYFGYEILGGADREAILGDLAVVEVAAGYRNAARDIHRLLAHTAQLLSVRATSMVNLIELAVRDGDEHAYERARLDFTAFQRAHQVSVEQRLYAELYVAMGLERFGSPDTAMAAYRRLVSDARVAKLHQLEHEATQLLESLLDRVARQDGVIPPISMSVEPPAYLRYITDTISAAAAKVLVIHGIVTK